jgi:HD-GYP domain-containing protein (c-di-GMP phosphodiesterase class II)
LLIPLILVVIGEAVVVIYIVIFMKRRHRTRHQMRVAELASAIAREMNLSNKLVKMLLLFGILRDPDLIESPYPEAKTAIQYNRRLKGSGYPQKLAGDNILLEARIMAVADMFETISSPRPNRPAIGLDQALEEFSRSKSALYAADVVQALIRLVKQGNFKFRTQYS